MSRETDWVARTLQALRASGHRNGSAQRAVIELLGTQDCCLTAQEAFDRLRETGRPTGLASVYRVLELLVERGLVQRIDVGGGVARFEASYASGDHHHHLVCNDCGKVEAFTDDGLEVVLRQVEGRVGYAIAAHEVVLHGECGDCRAA
jgi:Fur family ferric uptake transcriptional regulator